MQSLLGRMPLLLLALLGIAATAPATADPITGASCVNDSCQGGVYTLYYNGNALPDADPVHQTFRVFLDINTTAYTGGGLFLDQVAIKVSSSVFAATLFSAPSGAANWLLQTGGINAGGCSGSGGGFECANSGPALNGGKGVAVPVATIYTWAFDVTVNNGTLNTAPGGASIKARYVDASGNKVGDLVSEPITLQRDLRLPEPAPVALLFGGLVAALALRRRRK